MIESPADVKIVYRMGFPNQSLHEDSQVLSHFSRIQCVLVCHIFFNTSSKQYEVNYFLQIQPN